MRLTWRRLLSIVGMVAAALESFLAARWCLATDVLCCSRGSWGRKHFSSESMRCAAPGAPCSFLDPHYGSSCIQKHNFVRLLAYTYEVREDIFRKISATFNKLSNNPSMGCDINHQYGENREKKTLWRESVQLESVRLPINHLRMDALDSIAVSVFVFFLILTNQKQIQMTI